MNVPSKNVFAHISYTLFQIRDPSDQNKIYVAFLTFLVLYIPRKGSLSFKMTLYCSIMFVPKVMSNRYD